MSKAPSLLANRPRLSGELRPPAISVEVEPGRSEAREVVTAKLTANLMDIGGRSRTSADGRCAVFILTGRWRTAVDDRSAVFKTVCGALLRRPGWVRFPSVPANSVALTTKMTATAPLVSAATWVRLAGHERAHDLKRMMFHPRR